MPSGLEVKAAIKKSSTWGIAAACGANDGVLLAADTLKKSVKDHIDDSLGLAFAESRDPGEIKCEGALKAFMRYDGLDVPIALAMGDAGAPVQQGATQAYANTIRLKADIDGLFATIAVNKAINVFEYPSAKITGFTIKAETGGPVEIEFDAVCDNEAVDSTVNTLAGFNGVTWPEKSNRVLMSHASFRMNDFSGAALSDGDRIYPSSFELSFKRKLKADYVIGGQNKIIEPANDGLPEIRLKLRFPRYTSITYLSALGSDGRKKMDMTFTGALIESPYYRQFKLSMPHLALINAEAATSKGRIVHPLEFSCLAAQTAPSGMAGILMPFQVDVVNKRSANPLG